LFCSDHAPLLDLTQCWPPYLLQAYTARIESTENFEFIETENVRLCKTCKFEIFHAEGIFQEVWDNKEKLSFSYWQDVVFEGSRFISFLFSGTFYSRRFTEIRTTVGKASALFDCSFPISVEDVELLVEKGLTQNPREVAPLMISFFSLSHLALSSLPRRRK
jgi:hypothetical protein